MNIEYWLFVTQNWNETPYSGKFSWGPIFMVFADKLLSVKIRSTKYSSSQKTVTLPFCSAPFRRRCTVHASCIFRMHACIISNWAWSFDVQKKEGQLVDSPTRINSFILLWSSKLFWGSSLLPLFDFERILRSRLDWVRNLLSTIDQFHVASRL